MLFRSTGLVSASLVLWLSSSCSRPPAATSQSGPPDQQTAGFNHLAGEKSPYLQLHAGNPVDWYPWGAEAFERARREDKPIFLSIGYAACHWCHVMEAESFSNAAVAETINRSFVAIKVDREERPDVERVYLTYLTSISSGGWPMTLFLTPDLKPFYGATYLPPDTRDGEEGLRQVAMRLGETWRSDRRSLLRAAADGTSIVQESAQIPRAAAAASDERAIDETYASLAKTFDRVNGGFGSTTKFPRPVVLAFLLRYYARTGTTGALEIATATLQAMAGGGIRDHLGGGFHRYTVDPAWRVPHFEKMLYDQAQLISVYTDAFQLTRNPEWAVVARDTIDYVLRDLRDPRGGFYSAEDADSGTSPTDARLAEGVFYTWTGDDFNRLLGADAALARYYYELPPSSEGSPASAGLALTVHRTVADVVRQFSVGESDVRTALERVRIRLVEARARRPRPAKDDAMITAWNGLMISALARAGQVLDEPRYVDAALQAGRFVESRLFDGGSDSLQRRARHEVAEIEGLLEDYAFFIQGLLDLYEASHDPHWLQLALRLQDTQDRWFWDQTDGAYFSTREDAAHLLARMKEDYDGAEPSANSVSAMNLLRLWQLLETDRWRGRADATFHALSGRVARSGSAMPQLMSALDFRRSTPEQIVIAGDPGAADTRVLLRLVHDRFLPHKVLSVVDGGVRQAELAALVPPLAAMERRNGRATFYLCENYACRLPTNDPVVAERLLSER